MHLGVYSLSKIAAEQVVQFAAREHDVPTTIIRIFSTYGPLGGAPADRLDTIVRGDAVVLHPDSPNRYNPIYEDDYVRLGIRALEIGAVPPVVVNWAGSETVSAEDYCAHLGALVGREAAHRVRRQGAVADLAGRHEDARAPRPDGGAVARRHASHGCEARHPDLLVSTTGPR